VANDGGVRPGWYADPLGRFELRYFNGATWTADVSTSGERFVDPLGLDVGQHSGQPACTGTTAHPPTSLATASMVLGIVAVATAWIPFIVVVGAIAAVLALVFGVVAIRRSGPSGAGRSRAVVGVITGASALLAAALGAVLTFVVLDVYDAYLNPPPHTTAITSCEVVGSRAIATGRLENLGEDTSDFSVLVGFVRPDTDNPHRTTRITLDDVGAGTSAPFEAERQVELDDVDCIVIEVTGPLPFGLALD
jgi:hypothetical protein